MFLFSKNQSIGNYIVVFPHKEGKYAQTYRVKDKDGKVKFLKLIFMEKLEVFQIDNSGNLFRCILVFGYFQNFSAVQVYKMDNLTVGDGLKVWQFEVGDDAVRYLIIFWDQVKYRI